MVPKPFPFQIGVGVDICRINRIASILRPVSTRNRWARRVFTRLEWPALCRRFDCAANAKKECDEESEVLKNRSDRNGKLDHADKIDSAAWMLPSLSPYSSILEDEDETAYWSAIADDRSALGVLARHLAGRWAAKEAAIKAHQHRQLYMQDVSIVTKFSSSASHLDAENGRKTIALIEPICDRIEMDKRVAALRGLRGFGPHNHGLHSTNQNPEMTGSDKVQHYNRRSRVKESDRQIADINISHDGDYAVAVCMGFDPPISQIKEKCIVDNGKGLPLHEPQWGDEGWLDLTKPGVDGGVFGLDRSSDELLDETDKST